MTAADRALAGFEAEFGGMPDALVRAPGRINLIGEHIDYCDLTVLPIALSRAVWLAFRATEDGSVSLSTDADGLGHRSFEASPSIPPGPPGDWSNYVRAAIQAVHEGRHSPGRGYSAFVASDVPVAAGLSSSSALVVAAALAWYGANDLPVPPRAALAARLAAGERYVGTAGGGMDQAACLLGRTGHALAMDFAPLRVTPVPLPPDWRFVVAFSGQTAEKSGAAQDAYNERTRVAAAAADAVAAELGDPSERRGLDRFVGLLARQGNAELLAAAERVLGDRERRRFRHIVTEAARVGEAVDFVRSGDIDGLGAAMFASHASLRDDYEVSTPALDAIVDSAREAGAAGARLTGAGMGGCAIALCRQDSAEAVLEAVASPGTPPSGPRIAFIAEAADGAAITTATVRPGSAGR